MKQYYICKPDCTPEGPYPEEMVRTCYEQGIFPANTLIWFDGTEEWMPIQNIFTKLRTASSTSSASYASVSSVEPDKAAVSSTLIENSSTSQATPEVSAIPTPQTATPAAAPLSPQENAMPKQLQRWNPITAYVSCMKRYFQFSGRASRSEYFFFHLACLILLLVLCFILAPALSILGRFGTVVGVLLYCIIYYGSLIPSIAVTARRFHDTGRSGWMMLIPVYSSVIVFLPSKNDNNPYGSAPLPPA